MKQTLTSIDYQKLFLALPERYVVFVPSDDDYLMVDASEAYLQAVGKRRTQVVGKKLFEVFPDTSPMAQKTGKGALARSLERCIKSNEPDFTGVIRYDIPDKKGKLSLRYWQATHYPILGESGAVEYIVQHTEDITEMVLESEQRKLAEAQFDEILATGLVGSWSWDVVTNTVRADKGLAKLFGVPQKEAAVGLPLSSFVGVVHPKDRDRVKLEIDETLAYKEEFQSEYRTVGKHGEVHWVIARGRVERDEDGNPISFPGVLIDITDRKNIEHELKESERRLTFLVDTMPQLIWVARADGYYEYYNARWYEYTGMSKGLTSYDDRNALIHPDDKKRAREQWVNSQKSGMPYEIQYRLYHAPSDSYRWVIGRAEPFRDENGKILKWYGTCTDIDDQKQAADIQAFLADISKELAMTLDINKTLKHIAELAVPVLGDWCSFELLNSKGEIEQISVAHKDPAKVSIAKKFREMSPVTLDQPTGVPYVIRTGKSEFHPVITDELIDKAVVDEEIKQFLFDIKLRSSMAVPLFIKNKPAGAITFISSESLRNFDEYDLDVAEDLASRVSAFLTNTTLYNESLETIAYRKQLEEQLKEEKTRLEMRVEERTSQLQLTNIGLMEEIKKRQQIESELMASSKELKRSNQELQDFAYVSSHDLQEPLRKIRAFGDLLRSEYGDQLGEGGEYLERMQNAATRMSTLIEDLLAFSRVSTKPMENTVIDLNKIVKEVVYDLETRVRDTNAHVMLNPLPRLKADEIYMRQLFQNLIGNALKFHKPGQVPVVEVSGKQSGKWVEISIRDEGIGFEEKYLDRIFAVFQRLHGKDAYEGTGIGLAVCRKIVERYGGTITATSKKDHGTTFIVRLPAAEGKGTTK